MKKFDEIDENIISVLTRDARTSNREVARIVGLSDTGVRKRLKRFSSTGVAKVTAVVNPASVGLSASAFIRLQTTPAVARSVVDAAAQLSFVSFAALTAGRFNVLFLVLAKDQDDLAEMVHEHFRCWEGIRLIEVVQLIGVTKHRLDLTLINK